MVCAASAGDDRTLQGRGAARDGPAWRGQVERAAQGVASARRDQRRRCNRRTGRAYVTTHVEHSTVSTPVYAYGTASAQRNTSLAESVDSTAERDYSNAKSCTRVSTSGADARLDRRRDALSVLDHAEGFRGGGDCIDQATVLLLASPVPPRVLLRLRVQWYDRLEFDWL